jgi:hypothetical protein
MIKGKNLTLLATSSLLILFAFFGSYSCFANESILLKNYITHDKSDISCRFYRKKIFDFDNYDFVPVPQPPIQQPTKIKEVVVREENIVQANPVESSSQNILQDEISRMCIRFTISSIIYVLLTYAYIVFCICAAAQSENFKAELSTKLSYVNHPYRYSSNTHKKNTTIAPKWHSLALNFAALLLVETVFSYILPGYILPMRGSLPTAQFALVCFTKIGASVIMIWGSGKVALMHLF